MKPSSAPCSFFHGSQLSLLKDAETSSFKTALPASLLFGVGPTFFSASHGMAPSPQDETPSVGIPLAVESPDLSQVRTSGGGQRENGEIVRREEARQRSKEETPVEFLSNRRLTLDWEATDFSHLPPTEHFN